MSVLESVNFANIIPILNNVVLVIAILWLLLQVFLLWGDIQEGESITPSTIPSLFLFAIAITTVLVFHFSPLHLIWLTFACSFVGFGLMLLPPVQQASMGVVVLLAGGGFAGFGPPDEQEREYIVLDEADLDEMESISSKRVTSKKKKRQQKAMKSAKSSKKKGDKGFG